jgi:arylsulfatase A-like enzyme
MFYPVLDGALEVNALGGGDTGAPQVWHNDVPRGWYHTDWVADRTINWLDSLDAGDDWFCWMSFPDPHHPWDPPKSELGRIDWRDVPLPAGYHADPARREAVLDAKPRHWRAWYDGRLVSNYEAPLSWVPATLTPDQVREVNAVNAVECELIDEAIGRVLAAIAARGWDSDVDVVFTTDHGELQGDFGLLFKGPYHVDALMRIPLVWRPAPSSGALAAAVTRPVGLVDLAPTFCAIAGIEAPAWMEGRALPVDDADADRRGFERVLTEWDSVLFGVDVHLRTITRDGWVCTEYLPGYSHDGSEGELYSLVDDPLQEVNRWDDPALKSLRDDLIADLRAHRPEPSGPQRRVVAPV